MDKFESQDGWLRLSEAADYLGVHPSTVRKWSDKSVLPVHLTQGRHRRYKRSELELWKQARQADKPIEADLVVQSALRTTRIQISEGKLENESWYNKLDDEARRHYRESGRGLLQGLISYLASSDQAGIAEAEALGYDYASRGRRYGMDCVEAAHAFIFFRNQLMDAMLEVYESAAVHSPSAWSEMFRRLNSFTDGILVTILRTYENFRR